MDINHKEMLKTQIKEAYGQLVYTQTTHLKLMDRLNLQYSVLKWIQIALSAATTAGLIGTLITTEKAYTVISEIMSALLLFINLYFKNFNPKELATSHKQTADELWIIREQYKSCLSDFDYLTDSDIMQIRDNLLKRTAEIYKSALPTDHRAYKKAQKALKQEEEQYFAPGEVDSMLPEHLRRNPHSQNR